MSLVIDGTPQTGVNYNTNQTVTPTTWNTNDVIIVTALYNQISQNLYISDASSLS
jgi:hypothetical protein